ncbi:pitrilysin family protein [Polyangium sp. 15x6]|uniref:M16 family metallopeptidase n=1 Tax=Polyangium sp. 15x6 TaxID=3042687 RepID=UPI00249BB3D1|nr:pitrilysin family protein [Polyangium sp. 15x6]MDI3291717.1 pitrilysin family protein [Polyangium sp. 15x6]
MKKLARRSQIGALLGLSLFSLAACQTPAPVVPPPPDPPPEPGATQQAPKEAAAPPPEDPSFRKTPPQSGGDMPFIAPKIDEARLSNGLRVLYVMRREMPVVAVNIVVNRGAEQEPASGLTSTMASMMLSGTKQRSAIKLSEELGAIGARYGAWADHDGVGLTAQALREKAPELFAILADVVLNPAFDPAELERERARRLTSILQQADQPGVLLQNAITERLYPAGHPYREPLIGTEASVKAIKPADLARQHAALFRPEHTTVTIAGNIDKAAALALVEKSFAAWKGQGTPAKTPKDPPAVGKGEKRVFLVDRPGATQSYVAVTLAGVPRKNPDFDALMVMNTLLGGQFTSRLNLNLREKHAYTYGARSGFDMRHGSGPFTAGGAIMTPATAPAVKEIFAEIERLRKELVSAEDLADAKANLVRQLPARFETAGETAGTLASLSVQGLPLDELATRPSRISKISAEDVKRVAEKYLRPDQMRVIVVGDAAVVEKELAALDLGGVEVRKAPAKKDAKAEPKKEAAKGAPVGPTGRPKVNLGR